MFRCLSPFDHPRHLKSGGPPPPPGFKDMYVALIFHCDFFQDHVMVCPNVLVDCTNCGWPNIPRNEVSETFM